MSDEIHAGSSIKNDALQPAQATQMETSDGAEGRLEELSGHLQRAGRTANRTGKSGALGLTALEMAEGGLLADVGIVLDLASIYLPIIGAVLTPTVPTPFAILTLRRGLKVALVACAVSMLLVTMLAGPHFGWRMGLEAGVGMLMGWAMRHRWRAPTIIAAGTAVVATVTFAAALLVLVATGLPVHDVVQELRNVLKVVAGLAAFAASVVGLQGQWMAIRPGLVSLGTFALRFWPALLYLYATAFALPAVILYYAIANSAARVLGEQTRPFPPRWIARLLVWGFRFSMWCVTLVTAVLLSPFRGARALRRRLAGRRGQP